MFNLPESTVYFVDDHPELSHDVNAPRLKSTCLLRRTGSSFYRPCDVTYERYLGTSFRRLMALVVDRARTACAQHAVPHVISMYGAPKYAPSQACRLAMGQVVILFSHPMAILSYAASAHCHQPSSVHTAQLLCGSFPLYQNENGGRRALAIC